MLKFFRIVQKHPTQFLFKKAIHLPTKDIVALKIVKLDDEDNLEAMLGEVRIMKLCNHPHIVKFYGAWFREEEIFVRIYLILILMSKLIILLDRHGVVRRRLRA